MSWDAALLEVDSDENADVTIYFDVANAVTTAVLTCLYNGNRVEFQCAWDGLFAEGADLELLLHVCLAFFRMCTCACDLCTQRRLNVVQLLLRRHP